MSVVNEQAGHHSHEEMKNSDGLKAIIKDIGFDCNNGQAGRFYTVISFASKVDQ